MRECYYMNVLIPPPPSLFLFLSLSPSLSPSLSLSFSLSFSCSPFPLSLSFPLSLIASRNVSDWWLAYWVSHAHHPSHFNISYYNTSDSDTVVTSLPFLPITSASDSLTYYLGIYGGLAAANSVSFLVLMTDSWAEQ